MGLICYEKKDVGWLNGFKWRVSEQPFPCTTCLKSAIWNFSASAQNWTVL